MMRALLLAGVCMVASAGLAAKDALAPEDIDWSERHASDSATHALAQQLWVTLDADGPAAALALLDKQSDLALQQVAAHALLTRLSQAAPRTDATVLLNWAKAQPVRLWVQHEETAAKWYLPVLDLAATARALEELWQMQTERQVWVGQIKASPQAAIRLIAAADAQAQQRAGEALAGLPGDVLAEISRLSVEQPYGLRGAWWHGLGRVRPSAPVVERLRLSSEAAYRLEAIRISAQRLDWVDAEPLLSRFEQDAELASASTLALIELALSTRGPAADKQDALITDRLIRAETRNSAIAALARLNPVVREKVVTRLWSKHADASARSGLQQALRLADDASADALLKRLVPMEMPQ